MSLFTASLTFPWLSAAPYFGEIGTFCLYGFCAAVTALIAASCFHEDVVSNKRIGGGRSNDAFDDMMERVE